MEVAKGGLGEPQAKGGPGEAQAKEVANGAQAIGGEGASQNNATIMIWKLENFIEEVWQSGDPEASEAS